MSQIRHAVFLVLLIFMASVSAGQNPSSGIWINYDSMSQTRLPPTGNIPNLLLDFEYLENEIPKAFVSDINDDGTEDYLVEWKHCGTGGCSYTLLDGKTKKRIGDLFGSPILILDQKINGYPIIQSYQHLSVQSGGFETYVFDGNRYQVVSSVYLEGNSVEELFKNLNKFRKVKAPKKN